MNEILLGLKLYFGVVLGKLAVVGIIFLCCFILAAIACVFGKKVKE
jgi:hypothetical protein